MSSENNINSSVKADDTITILDNVSTIIENLQITLNPEDGSSEAKNQEIFLLREQNSFQSAATLKRNTPKRNTSYSDIEGIKHVQGSPLLRRCNTGQSTSRPNLNKIPRNNDIEGTSNKLKTNFLRRYESFQSALKPNKSKGKSSDENLHEFGEKSTSDRNIKSSLMRRYASFQSALKPSINKRRSSSGNLTEEIRKEKSPFLQRYGSFQSSLRPKLRQVGDGIRKLSCVTKDMEEEIPVEATTRHKSIDIGVGLARRMSLFLFTKRTVCVHPYHPYTPAQSTRKIHFGFDSSKT